MALSRSSLQNEGGGHDNTRRYRDDCHRRNPTHPGPGRRTRCGPPSSTAPATSASRRSRARAPGVGEAVDPRHDDDDLRHRRPHRQGRVPGPPGPDHRPRAGRRHRGARPRRHRLRDRRARPRRRDHPVRPVPRLPRRATSSQCGHGDGLRGDRRLALRQHDRRRPGRVPPRPVGAGQPRADPRRRDRRAGRPPRRHRVDRLQPAPSRAASGSATRSSCSPRARSACARRPARS